MVTPAPKSYMGYRIKMKIFHNVFLKKPKSYLLKAIKFARNYPLPHPET